MLRRSDNLAGVTGRVSGPAMEKTVFDLVPRGSKDLNLRALQQGTITAASSKARESPLRERLTVNTPGERSGLANFGFSSACEGYLELRNANETSTKPSL
jgi:hypothetical protein